VFLVDLRWIALIVCVLAAGVGVALLPALINPILVAVAVGTLLYIVFRLGQPPTDGA
jgi:hypothetical protein